MIFLRRLIALSPILALLLAIAAGGEPACGAPPPAPLNRPAARSKAFAPENFLRAFRGNREDARHRVLDAAEEFHTNDARLPPALWQVIEPALKTPQVPESLLRAVRLYVRLNDPEADRRHYVLLTAIDPRVAVLAVDAIARRRPEGALERLSKLKEQPAYGASYAFRHAIVMAVARFDEPASVEFLIAAIGSLDGQLKYEAARQLARLTGQNLGGKSSDWKDWWERNRDGFQVARAAQAPVAGAKPPPAIPWDYDVPQFFGTPIFAKRVVFVIDISRSMLSSVDGVTRLEDAEKELEAAIRKLPDDTWFEIIAYNDAEQAFRGRLVQATPDQKARAARFTYSLVADGKTDVYDTLADALQVDPYLEAILFLSDGDPNVGTIVDRPTIAQMITQQNAGRRVSINTIGIDARGASEDFLKQLAADNFGEFRSLR